MPAEEGDPMKKLVVGSGSAFWGDMLEPAVEMAERSDVQYIGFDHLAELTMALLNRAKARNPETGFIPDIVPWMKAVLPVARRRGIKVTSNAGGANPLQAVQEVEKVARELGLSGLRIAAVTGDDVLAELPKWREQGWKFQNLDTGEEDLGRIASRIVAANVYLGSEAIVSSLREGADVVVTGRVSDNALFVGPLMHEFGWDFSGRHADRIGAAITVGHIVECACCASGGMSNHWRSVERPWEVGFPIAEVFENGEAVITKTPGSGGLVNSWTIKEHLLYESLDPKSYLMPDGIADFTGIHLEDVGPDRVRVTGMGGRARPDTLKVCIGYKDGFIGEGFVFFSWPDAIDKARWAAEWVQGRLRKQNVPVEELRVDLVGVNMLHGAAAPLREDPEANEIGLRVAARTEKSEDAEAVRRELTHLWTAGPLSSCFGVPIKVRPVVSLWPSLIPREAATSAYRMVEVK
jgi:hypothetical protein